jgi:hypothetical protein
MGEGYFLRGRALEVEFRGVLQDQHGTTCCPDAQGGGREMPLEDLVFADIPIGKEPVGRLGVRPVLERRWQRFTRPLTERLKHSTEPTVQPLIPQIASGDFRFHPALPHARTSRIRCHMTNHDYMVVAKTKAGR